MKKTDYLIIIAVILNIFLMLYLIIFLPDFSRKEEENEFTGGIDDMPEEIVEFDEIFIQNIAKFTSEYEGDFTPASINNIVFEDVNGKFKQIYLDSKKTKNEKYFNTNKEEISNSLGITELVDFKELMEYFVAFDNENDIKTATLRNGSVIKGKETTKYILDLVFNDEQKLSLKVEVNNLITNDIPLVKISPLKEDS